jgi:staphylococcal nuclease domain-containing protein 1
VEWGLNMMPDGEKLRSAERAAKAGKVGQWKNWVPPPSNQTKLSGKFSGHVVEVVSGDCLIVRDSSSRTTPPLP